MSIVQNGKISNWSDQLFFLYIQNKDAVVQNIGRPKRILSIVSKRQNIKLIRSVFHELTGDLDVTIRQQKSVSWSSQNEFHNTRGPLKRKRDVPTVLIWRYVCRIQLTGEWHGYGFQWSEFDINTICDLNMYISIHKNYNFKLYRK